MPGATIDRYRTMIRQPVYGLWSGKLDMSGFIEIITDALWMGLKGAWEAGAKAAGIMPDEMTDREISQMQTDIFNQFQYVPGFGQYIQSVSRAAGGKLESTLPRMGMWVARYKEFYERGMLMAKSNLKYRWTLGIVKTEHCNSCLKLSGKIKRASQWLEANIYPKSPDLECGGQHCACTYQQTNEPMSKGRLPKIP